MAASHLFSLNDDILLENSGRCYRFVGVCAYVCLGGKRCKDRMAMPPELVSHLLIASNEWSRFKSRNEPTQKAGNGDKNADGGVHLRS